MLRIVLGCTFIAFWLSQVATAEEYLVVDETRYLGRVSSADKNNFITCKGTVLQINDRKREKTQERCGTVWTMDVPKFQLLLFSEGAAVDNNPSLAGDALKAAVKIQDDNLGEFSPKAKQLMKDVQSKAGDKAQKYVDAGKAAFAMQDSARK